MVRERSDARKRSHHQVRTDRNRAQENRGAEEHSRVTAEVRSGANMSAVPCGSVRVRA